jgi:hypothetical protein
MITEMAEFPKALKMITQEEARERDDGRLRQGTEVVEILTSPDWTLSRRPISNEVGILPRHGSMPLEAQLQQPELPER